MLEGFHYIPKSKQKGSTRKKVSLRWFINYLLQCFLPFRSWLLNYRLRDLKPDILSGLTVSAILVPQAMAYAFLVGLPPQMGLYAVLPAVALGALFGSSKQIVTGPVGIVSLLTITVLLPYAEVGSDKYIHLAIVLAFGVGLMQLFLGIFRFGFLARLIPHSVLIGFSSAAAIIIGSTQVPSLLGFKIEQQTHVFQTFWELIKHIGEVHIPTLIVGTVAFLFIFTVKRFRPTFPASLTAIIIGIILSYLLDFEQYGISVVGHIPSSIPTPRLDGFSLKELMMLGASSLVIGMVGFVETFSIAKSIANKTKDKISANQELIGQGMANLGSSVFGGLPVSGSFSSTGVNFDTGAKTGLSALVVSVMAAITLLFLTPIFYYLPRTILAAVVMVGVAQLISPEKFREAFRISRTDGMVAVLTFLTAFAFKPDDAIMAGTILALALFLQRIMWAHVYEEGFDYKWGHILRTLGEKDEIVNVHGMVILRVDMSIFYANIDYVLNQMERLYKKRKRGQSIKMWVIDFSAVNYIDLSALEALGGFFDTLRKDGVEIYGIYVKPEQRRIFKKSKFIIGNIKVVHNIEELHKLYTQKVK